jgi:DNA-binding response OmpR family regulator
MAKKILIVDDEMQIVQIVRDALEKAGFRTITAYDGEQALTLFRSERPHLMILDLMLPGMDGLDVARTIRKESDIPILMLTARTAEADRVAGLELGADDYVVKPFSPRELVARVRAILRRAEGGLAPAQSIEAGDITIDLGSHRVRRQGRPVELTPTEFELLKTLARHRGQVLTRLQLMEAVRGSTYENFERTIDSHIRNLRWKLEPDPKRPRYILTVYGIGYKFSEEGDGSQDEPAI